MVNLWLVFFNSMPSLRYVKYHCDWPPISKLCIVLVLHTKGCEILILLCVAYGPPDLGRNYVCVYSVYPFSLNGTCQLSIGPAGLFNAD